MSEQPFPSSTEVCIVGAGPTGLACALGLAARQIPFVIVDALLGGHNGSRAIFLQPGSLESLGAFDPQVAADLVATGIQAQRSTCVDQHDRVVLNIPFEENLRPYTKYPFPLSMPQHAVEHQMRQSLQLKGHNVHFNKRVCQIKEVHAGSRYELRFESGEALTARYVVAADGHKSFLRSFAGIPYVDPYTKKLAVPGPNDPSFVVADVLFKQPSTYIPRDGLRMKIGTDGFVLTGPIRDPFSCDNLDSEALFRLYIGTSKVPPQNPDISYLQGILDAQGPGSSTSPRDVPKIAKVLHSARYRTRNALADRFMHTTGGGAYILLAGDAAHTHGPAGGQGMNLGICDGCDLANAIDEHRNASVASGKSGMSGPDTVHILEAYSTRRRAFARGIMDMVQGMSAVEAGGVGWVPYLRITVLRILARLPYVRGWLAWNVSALAYAWKT